MSSEQNGEGNRSAGRFGMTGAEADPMFSHNGATLHSNSFLLECAVMHGWFESHSAAFCSNWVN